MGKKVTNFTLDASPTVDDLVMTINDPSGTPANRKVSLSSILSLFQTGLTTTFASGTKMIFYQDTAPTGWTIQNTLDDKLVYITKGSAAGGQTGGGVHSTGSWVISGITVDAHTHTGPSHTHTVPSHTHTVPRDGWGAISGGGAGRLNTDASVTNSATGDNTSGAVATGATGTEGTGASGTASANTITSSGTWRPSSYCCIICSKD